LRQPKTTQPKPKNNSFLKQAAILAAASLLVRFIGFLYRLPLTDLIGNRGNGIYSAGYNLYTFFLILSSAGLPAAISKMVSERIAFGRYKDAHRVFQVSLIAASVLGLAGSLALGFGARGLANAIKSPLSYYSILSLSPTVLIVAVMSVFRGYFQGMNNTVPTALSQIIEQVFNAVFSVALAYVFMGGHPGVGSGLSDLYNQAAANAEGLSTGAVQAAQGIAAGASGVAANALNGTRIALGAAGGTAGTGVGAASGLILIAGIYLLARPSILRRLRKDTASEAEPYRRLTRELLGISFPIIAGVAIFSVTNLIDLQMVMGRLAASHQFTEERMEELYGMLTGKYVVLTTLPVSLSTAMATAALPNIAATRIKGEKEATRRKINMTLRIVMMLSIPAAVGIGVLGNQILTLLFPRYPDGGILLQIGAVSVIFLALVQITTGMLQAVGRVQVPVVAALAGALLKIPLNYVLIAMPAVNVSGAVISTTVCYIVASGIDFFVLQKSTGLKPDYPGIFVKPLAASAVMGLACFVLYYTVYYLYPSNTVALLLSVVFGVGLYAGVLFLLGGIRREDLSAMPMSGKLTAIYDKLRPSRPNHAE